MQFVTYRQLDLHVAVGFDCPEVPCGWCVVNFTCVIYLVKLGVYGVQWEISKSYYCLDSAEGWSLLCICRCLTSDVVVEEERQSIHSFITPSVVRPAPCRAFWTPPETNRYSPPFGPILRLPCALRGHRGGVVEDGHLEKPGFIGFLLTLLHSLS